jgi:hypothetical protein
MEQYLAALLVFALVIAGMAVGVIFSGRRIKGSCGGLSTMSDELGQPLCECGAPPGSCAEGGRGTAAQPGAVQRSEDVATTA